MKQVANKVTSALSPALSCLQKAGASDAVLGYLKQCGSSKSFGKSALATCAATTYAPGDVKGMLVSSAKCFKLG